MWSLKSKNKEHLHTHKHNKTTSASCKEQSKNWHILPLLATILDMQNGRRFFMLAGDKLGLMRVVTRRTPDFFVNMRCRVNLGMLVRATVARMDMRCLLGVALRRSLITFAVYVVGRPVLLFLADGRAPCVLTEWWSDRGQKAPRLLLRSSLQRALGNEHIQVSKNAVPLVVIDVLRARRSRHRGAWLPGRRRENTWQTPRRGGVPAFFQIVQLVVLPINHTSIFVQ